MLADLLEESLRSLGHEVSGIASDVAESVHLIQHHRPDVAILDMRLGKEDGSDVIRALSSADRKGLGVLYITGWADYVPKTMGHGILSKPYTVAALQASVEIVVALVTGESCGPPPYGFQFCECVQSACGRQP